MNILLLIALNGLLLGVAPIWPHSRHWGYRPAGGMGIVLLVIIALMVANGSLVIKVN
jgi:hypothetical protein